MKLNGTYLKLKIYHSKLSINLIIRPKSLGRGKGKENSSRRRAQADRRGASIILQVILKSSNLSYQVPQKIK